MLICLAFKRDNQMHVFFPSLHSAFFIQDWENNSTFLLDHFFVILFNKVIRLVLSSALIYCDKNTTKSLGVKKISHQWSTRP